jgi:hypothetical protein
MHARTAWDRVSSHGGFTGSTRATVGNRKQIGEKRERVGGSKKERKRER